MATENTFQHQQIDINGISTHIIEAGDNNRPTILFLHGYPENWCSFTDVMALLKENYHILSLDMPGIGKSRPIESSDKFTIARFINDLIHHFNLNKVTLVGHDLGGMVAYSFLRNFPENISSTVIMNTAIPGVEPWKEVKMNPYIWHFAFFAIPELPEAVFSGKQDLLFDYFFHSIAAQKNFLTNTKKDSYVEAYESPSSLKTSFDWYRSFPQDEMDNSKPLPVDIPVLYLRGEEEYGDITQYLEGFKNNGLKNVEGALIPNSGHFAPEESPEDVAQAIDEFIKKTNLVQDLPVMAFKSRDDLRKWLIINHKTSRGMWLRIYKKNSCIESVNFEEVLDEGLSFGWSESKRIKGDEDSYLQRFTPRKTKGTTSQRNQAHVERLIKEKRMTPAGLKALGMEDKL